MPQSLLPLLQSVRSQYPAICTNDQCVEMLNKVAWQARDQQWGLLSKPAGNNGRRYDGALCSVDYLVYLPTGRGWDVFTDAGGVTTPKWSEDGDDSFPIERVVMPIAPQGQPEPVPVPTPEPVPPPPPPSVDLSPVLLELAALRAQITAVTIQVAHLVEKPAPSYSGSFKVFGTNVPVTLEPK